MACVKMRRLKAGLIDFVGLLAWLAIFSSVLWALATFNIGSDLNRLIFYGLALLIAVLVPVVIFSIFDNGKYCGSPGKHILQLQVVRSDGQKIGFGRALLRNFLKFGLPLFYVVLAVGVMFTRPDIDSFIVVAVVFGFFALYLWSIWLGTGKATYDLLADTLVVPIVGRRGIASDYIEILDDDLIEGEGEETIILPRRAIMPSNEPENSTYRASRLM